MAFHPALASWLERAPDRVDCVELIAERFYDSRRRDVGSLSAKFPIVARTRRLSLASPGPIDPDELASLASFVAEAKALWISDHLGFRYAPGIDLGAPCPVPLDTRTLNDVVDRARRVVEACRAPLLIRNIASPLVAGGAMSEPEFLNRFCDLTGCGISLDATALLVHARNHRLDPRRWLRDLDHSRIEQISVGGCREVDGFWDDTHDAPICDELLALLGEVLVVAVPRALILEWEARFPPTPCLEAELWRLKAIVDRNEAVRAAN